MSSFVVSDVDIDAVVSVAVSWTERGMLDGLPGAVREVLAVTEDRATHVGRTLLRANLDANAEAGPSGPADASRRSPDDPVDVSAYTFRRLHGAPSARVALHVVDFLDYQTSNGAWTEESLWTDGRFPFEGMFICGMRMHALVLAGALPPEALQDLVPDEVVDVYEVRVRCAEAEDELVAREPAVGSVETLPWGLDERDRDLFTRDVDA